MDNKLLLCRFEGKRRGDGGALLWSGFGKGWLGRLPGDINYTRGDFSFHFPLVTCLILSAVLTLLLWLFRK